MSKKLGLYIDTTSVNWSLIDQKTNDLIDLGVYVFPAGCENFGAGRREVSKKSNKRLLRLQRIRYARIRARKYFLLKLLVQHKMCPASIEEIKQWKKTKEFPISSVSEWIAMNPYKLRQRGLYEKLSLMEIGRIFYQISRHRGYRFGERNSKLMDNVLSKGIPSQGKIGYLHTKKQLKNDTLGTYLNSIYPPQNQSYKHSKERIRNRICTIEMYFEEVHRLWGFQAKFHKTLTNKLRESIIGNPTDSEPSGALFFQRPLKSQKFRVGNCLYEPKKTRCCVSSLPYQELEAWKWVNSIRYNSQQLKLDDAKLVVRYFLSHYRFRFREVKALLNLSSSSNFNYKDEDEFKGSFINAELSSQRYFGYDWFSMEEKEKEDIFHALYFYDSSVRLASCAEQKFGLSSQSATRFSKISIDKSYAQLSKMAAKKILYFLRKGHPYKTSIYLAGIKNALHTHWETLNEKQEKEIIDVTLKMHSEIPQHELLSELNQFFQKSLGLNDFKTEKLYGFSKFLAKKSRQKFIPKTKEINNQILQLKNATLVQSIFELRKVLNSIIEHYGPIKKIACELSADLKVNRMQRYLYKIDKKRGKQNSERYINVLKQLEVDLIPMHILKYELWEECKHTCPFSGNEIPLEMLFTEYVQIVYIHPWSRSLNDNSTNKTLCFTSIASKLNEQTPYEFFSSEKPEEWEQVKIRAAKLFSNTQQFPTSYKKFKRFVKKYSYRDVEKKQFNDGHQLSRYVGELLGIVTNEVNMIPGNITQKLIDEFLLMNIFPDRQCENDFRLNALKAYVNAYCSKHHVMYLSKRNKYLRNQVKSSIQSIHPHYLEQLTSKMDALLVKHKKRLSVVSKRMLYNQSEGQKHKSIGVSMRGLLHKDTLYGQRTAPESHTAMHIRRPIKWLKTTAQVEKIVDPIIRNLVKKQLDKNGEKGKTFSNNALVIEDDHGFPTTKVKLPNKKGDPVPVQRIRMRESFSNVIQLKTGKNRYAVPRNNHHIMIYVDETGNFKEQVVSFWEVTRRYRNNLPIYRQLDAGEGELVSYLHINDMFLMGLEKVDENFTYYPKNVLRKHLYRIQKLSTKYYEFRLANKQITSSLEAPEYIRINNFGTRKTGWQTYNPVKVKIDLIGNIELMNT